MTGQSFTIDFLQNPEYNIDRIYQHTALVFHRGNRLVLGRGIFFLGEVGPHAIAMRRTSQQIVTGHIVIGGGAHQEVQSAFPDSLLIVGKQRLGDTQIGCHLFWLMPRSFRKSVKILGKSLFIMENTSIDLEDRPGGKTLAWWAQDGKVLIKKPKIIEKWLLIYGLIIRYSMTR